LIYNIEVGTDDNKTSIKSEPIDDTPTKDQEDNTTQSSTENPSNKKGSNLTQMDFNVPT